MLPTFLGTGSNTGQLINLAILLGFAVGVTIALVLAVRYGRARGVTNRMQAQFPNGIVLTARSSNELQSAFERLDAATQAAPVRIPRYLTVVVDAEGVSFWVPMPFRDQATLDDRRLWGVPWSRIRTIEVGTAFVERPANSVVVVVDAAANGVVRVEFVPHQVGFFGGMGYDGSEIRLLVDRLRLQRPV